MGPLGHPYLDFHLSTPLSIFCLLLFFTNLLCPLLHSTLLSFFLCICLFFLSFFSRMDSYYTWKMNSSSIISNFLPFTSVRNGHPSNSGRQIPTLSQSRQRELVRVPAGFEYTTYIYSTWSVHYFPMVIM